jgi:hypothetical protein
MSTQNKDRFEVYLDEMILKVQQCQEEKSLKSCAICNHFLSCELRGDYVKSVYNSMSKGETGGFEF